MIDLQKTPNLHNRERLSLKWEFDANKCYTTLMDDNIFCWYCKEYSPQVKGIVFWVVSIQVFGKTVITRRCKSPGDCQQFVQDTLLGMYTAIMKKREMLN